MRQSVTQTVAQSLCRKWQTPANPDECRRANDGIRTRDLLITNQLLYQLSYIGVITRNPADYRDLREAARRFWEVEKGHCVTHSCQETKNDRCCGAERRMKAGASRVKKEPPDPEIQIDERAVYEGADARTVSQCAFTTPVGACRLASALQSLRGFCPWFRAPARTRRAMPRW